MPLQAVCGRGMQSETVHRAGQFHRLLHVSSDAATVQLRSVLFAVKAASELLMRGVGGCDDVGLTNVGLRIPQYHGARLPPPCGAAGTLRVL